MNKEKHTYTKAADIHLHCHLQETDWNCLLMTYLVKISKTVMISSKVTRLKKIHPCTSERKGEGVDWWGAGSHRTCNKSTQTHKIMKEKGKHTYTKTADLRRFFFQEPPHVLFCWHCHGAVPYIFRNKRNQNWFLQLLNNNYNKIHPRTLEKERVGVQCYGVEGDIYFYQKK